MNNNDRAGKAAAAAKPRGGKHGRRKKPEWADGLRRLYDSVLHEPLPDSFADLLARLDDEGT